MQHMNGTFNVVRFEPRKIATDLILRMVGEEKCVIMQTDNQSLGDGPDADRLGFAGARGFV